MTRVPGDKDFWWLFDAAAEAMLLADEGGAILARNASCDRLFGYAAEEWASVRIEDLIPPRFRAAHRHFRAAFAARSESRAMGRGGEFSALRKDGSEFTARISLSAVPGAEGPVVLAIIEDVTARRQTEETLRGREALLGLAVRVTGLAAWEWARDSDQAYLSPEWKAQIGYGDDELPSDADEWRARIHPDDVPGFRAVLDDFRTGSRREFDFKYRLCHRDGSFRWLQSRAVSLPTQEGEGSRLLGMQWDVTDRERRARLVGEWRREVDAARQLQVALATAASIGHEVNQPLNALVSLCETALLLSRQGRFDALEETLESAVKQAERASRLVPDVLSSLAWEEAPAVPIDLNRVVREAADLVMADGPSGMRIVPALPQESPAVLGNDIEVRMVVANLLRNSAEALAAAGMPGWPVMVTVGPGQEAGMAQVSVKDHGPGLAPGAAERIFEPFFTTKPRSIGMGLATSRRVVERFGGRLWSEGGGGAAFHFTLPLAT